MSIIRIGLSETKGFSDGYEAIFGKKDDKDKEKKDEAQASKEGENKEEKK